MVRGRDRASGSASILRSSAGSSRTRCRCTAAPRRVDEVVEWARAVVDAVRATGARQPISLGDGAWGIEVSGHDNGYSLRDLAPIVDFVGPHVYPMQDDQARQLLTASFVCELAASLGQPVVLEEFGVSSDFASDENAAHYYRQVLYTTLLAGARGWIAWNNCDYDDLRGEDPVPPPRLRDALRPDRPARATRRSSSAPSPRSPARSASSREEGWEPVKGDVAIVVPEHFERELPFTEPAYRQDIRDNLLQSYVAAREADLPVELQRERDGIADSARLYLAPCAKLLTAPGLDRLRALARRRRHRLPLLLRRQHDEPARPVADLARRDLRRDRIACATASSTRSRTRRPSSSSSRTSATSPQERGSPSRVAGEPSARSYLPVDPVGAEIVAIDAHGRPALLRHAARARQRRALHLSARAHGRDDARTRTRRARGGSTPRSRRPQTSRGPFGSTIRACSSGLLRTGATETAVFVNCSADAVGPSRSSTAGRPSSPRMSPSPSTRSASRSYVVRPGSPIVPRTPSDRRSRRALPKGVMPEPRASALDRPCNKCPDLVRRIAGHEGYARSHQTRSTRRECNELDAPSTKSGRSRSPRGR